MERLTEESQLQIIKFLKFFRSKREVALEQMRADFSDTKNDQLTEDMYTNEEVHGQFDSMSHVVADTARSEMGSMINMTVLLLAQLFESADEQGAELEMDTSSIENQVLLEEIEKMQLDKQQQAGKKGLRLKDTLAQTKKELMQAESDRDLAQGKYKSATKKYKREAEKSTRLENELELLRTKYNEKEAAKPAAESKDSEEEEAKNDDAARVPDVYDQILYSQADADQEAKEDDSAMEELLALPAEDLKKKIAEFQRKIRLLMADMDVKLSESKQFQQMKRMMVDKNKLLARARERLRGYEPDYTEESEM
jgi:hypothetical protein